MYCPNCGAKNSTEQKFCRFCGLNIETIIQSLQTQLAKKDNGDNFQILKWVKRAISFGSIFSASIGAVLLLGNFALNWQIDRSYTRIALLAFGIFRLLDWAVGYFYKPKDSAESADYDEVETSRLETNKLLEDKPFEPIQSVTENSTELLMVEKNTRKLN